MFNKIKVVIGLILIVCVLSGCTPNNSEYTDYSYALTKDGYYSSFDSYSDTVPDFSNTKISVDEVLDWCVKELNANTASDIDSYVEVYAKEFLTSLNITNKEESEIGDLVTASIEFFVDGEQLEDYTTTKSYKIEEDADAIVASFVNRKVGDTYQLEYSFEKDDPIYPSKKATVKVKIDEIKMGNPLTETVVSKNKDKINEYISGVTDVKSLLAQLRPKIAIAQLPDYIRGYIQKYSNVTVPQEFVDAEIYRLKTRLSKVGASYDEYIKSEDNSEESIRAYCEGIARENYIIMMLANKNKIKVTEEDVKTRFGDNYSNIVSVQGQPYTHLFVLREKVLKEIESLFVVVDNSGNPVIDKGSTEESSSAPAETSPPPQVN